MEATEYISITGSHQKSAKRVKPKKTEAVMTLFRNYLNECFGILD